MKFSLSWIKEHIDSPRINEIPAEEICTLIGQKTTEIESFTDYQQDLTSYKCVVVSNIDRQKIYVKNDENQSFELPYRSDARINNFYIIKTQPQLAWLTLFDCGADKEGLFPCVQKTTFTHTIINDHTIEIDNKAISHRPDLWGHRGLAREVAAIFNMQLKPLKNLLYPATIKTHSEEECSLNHNIIVKKQTKLCSNIALCTIDMQTEPCSFARGLKLAQINIRPLNNIIDITNYVMADIGHPMHAFDQKTFKSDFVIRQAADKERLELLDSKTIILSNHDIVIANETEAVSLAGILGGKASGITSETTSFIIEAAHFDSDAIRKTALNHKKRTDASSRFEKDLDTHNTITALQRFLYLAHENKPTGKNYIIHTLGNQRPLTTITIDHTIIEKFIGSTIKQEFIINTLESLEYQVIIKDHAYHVRPPSFRTTKQRLHAADIIEEIARFLGYNTIVKKPVAILGLSRINHAYEKIKELKKLCTFGLSMHETNSYGLFDEAFLNTLGWQPEKSLTIQSPVSDNWKQLNTSLIPHLLKAVHDNYIQHTTLNFFEIAPVWQFNHNQWEEKTYFCGIWYDQEGKNNFYDGKQAVKKIISLFGHSLIFEALKTEKLFWFEPFLSSNLFHNETLIGHAGMINIKLQEKITKHPNSSLFIAHFDLDWYQNAHQKIAYTPIKKYQNTYRDISFFIPTNITFNTILNKINNINPVVESIKLLEFLEDFNAPNKRIITIRVLLVDPEQTLTKEAVDPIIEKIKSEIVALGGTIR